MQWIGDKWMQLVENLTRHVHVSKTAGNLFADALLIALIGLVVVVLLRLLLNISRETSVAPVVTALESRETARELYARSLDRAHAGEFDAALTLLYRASLAVLAERAMLGDRSSATVGEVERALRRVDRAAAAAFAPIARSFTAVAYAERHAGSETWSEALRAFSELEQRRK